MSSALDSVKFDLAVFTCLMASSPKTAQAFAQARTQLHLDDNKVCDPDQMMVLLTLRSDKKARRLQVVVPVDFFVLHLAEQGLLSPPPAIQASLLRYLKGVALDFTPAQTAALLASLETAQLPLLPTVPCSPPSTPTSVNKQKKE